MPEEVMRTPVTRRVPTCPENHRESIAEFLDYMAARVELTLNDHRVLSMHDKSARLVGQIKYFRQQLATIRWLQSVNDQRRKANKSDGS